MKRQWSNKRWGQLVTLTVIISMIFVLSACGAASPDGGTALQYDRAENKNMAFSEQAKTEEVKADGFASAEPANSYQIEQMMIYRGSMYVKVDDIKEGEEEVTQIVKEAQGYLVNANQNENENRYYARFEFKIPVKGFYPVIDQINNLTIGKVTSQNINGTDVTEEYLDLESRLKAKRIYEERLLDLLSKATKTEDLLKISNDLSRVQEEIERMQGRQKYLSYHAAYSTLVIEMEQFKNKAAPTATTWEKSIDGFQKSITFMKKLFTSLFIGLFSFLPILFVLFVVLIIIWGVRRTWFKNHRRRIGKHHHTDKTKTDDTNNTDQD